MEEVVVPFLKDSQKLFRFMWEILIQAFQTIICFNFLSRFTTLFVKQRSLLIQLVVNLRDMALSNFFQRRSQSEHCKKWTENNFMDAPLKWIMPLSELGKMIKVWITGMETCSKLNRWISTCMVHKDINIKVNLATSHICKDLILCQITINMLIQWWTCNNLDLAKLIRMALSIQSWITFTQIWTHQV